MCVDVAQNRQAAAARSSSLSAAMPRSSSPVAGIPSLLHAFRDKEVDGPSRAMTSNNWFNTTATRLPRFRLRRARVAFYVLPANSKGVAYRGEIDG
jgi:hypothetical protein